LASFYKQKMSPYWWVRYRGANGKIKRESTGLKYDSSEQTKKAEVVRAQKSAFEAEQGYGVKGRRIGIHDEFDSWVVSWIERKGGSHHTVTYQISAWRTLRPILSDLNLTQPRQVTYSSAQKICDRLLEGRKRTTAHRLFKFFRSVMSESIRRGHIESSPIALFRFKGGTPKDKSELRFRAVPGRKDLGNQNQTFAGRFQKQAHHFKSQRGQRTHYIPASSI
jgi:hypothetical protein